VLPVVRVLVLHRCAVASCLVNRGTQGACIHSNALLLVISVHHRWPGQHAAAHTTAMPPPRRAAVGSDAAEDSEEDAGTSSGSARPSSIHSPAQTPPTLQGSGTGSGSGASLPSLLLGLGLQPLLVSRIARLAAGLLACALFVRPFFASVMDLAAAAHMPAFYAAFVAAPLAVLLQPVQLAWCKAGKRGRRHVNTAMAQLMHMCGLVNTLGLLVVFCSQAVAGRAAGGLLELVLTLLPVLLAAAVAATQARVKCYWAPAAVALYAVTLLASLLLRLVLH
jgi:hypothetical protein